MVVMMMHDIIMMMLYIGHVFWLGLLIMTSKTAATKPLPIERALKTDILTILVVCMNINIMKDGGLFLWWTSAMILMIAPIPKSR